MAVYIWQTDNCKNCQESGVFLSKVDASQPIQHLRHSLKESIREEVLFLLTSKLGNLLWHCHHIHKLLVACELFKIGNIEIKFHSCKVNCRWTESGPKHEPKWTEMNRPSSQSFCWKFFYCLIHWYSADYKHGSSPCSSSFLWSLQGYMVHVTLRSISGTNQQLRWPP